MTFSDVFVMAFNYLRSLFFPCYEILHLFFFIIFYHGCYKINFSHCTFWAFKGALTSKLYDSLFYA